MMASSMATVSTVSSVNTHLGWKSGKSLLLIDWCSNIDPMMSPAVAPILVGCLLG
jgi:hypothetical protein